MASKVYCSTKVNTKIISFDKKADEKIVYHYTSQDVLCKLFSSLKEEEINKNSCLDFWATSIMYLNDETEYSFFENKLRHDLEIYMEEHHPAEKGLLRNFPHLFLRDIFIPPSIISLSENNDYLPMWKMYGNNAKGVCIGFSLNKLKEYFEVNKCEYTSFDEEDRFSIDYLEKIYMHLKGCAISENQIIPYDGAFAEFNNTFLIKNKEYAYENEWRIHLQDSKYDFIIKDDIIKPHVIAKIPLSCMRSITLGPDIKNKKVSLSAIRLLLGTKIGKKNASQIECKLSERNYRDI